MECHYKILGLEQNADEESIKKAYRKAALKYHPDKNPDNLEEATEKFRLVQAAYDVLSDPQERAWYDRHREEILHRKQYENYKDNSTDLFVYFNPSVYRGFGDDEKGFYSVYRDVFNRIVAEDKPFASSDSEDEEMPTFGDSKSDFDEVVHVFYATWQAYSTRMSFVWENQYDVKEAPNRRVARIIEKENKKERDKHKRKKNDLVRELVSFVRKRDPRVKAHKVELERIASEQTQKAEERRASLIRERVKEAALYDVTNKEERMKHEERVSQLEDMMKDEFGFTSSEEENSPQGGSDSEGEEEDFKDDLFCVACNKMFKSEMGFRNHKKSKKHKEKVNQLQEEMRDEKEEMKESEEAPPLLEETRDDDEQQRSGKLSKKQKKQRKQQQKLLSNMMSSEPLRLGSFDEELDSSQNKQSNKIQEDDVISIDATVANGNLNEDITRETGSTSVIPNADKSTTPINGEHDNFESTDVVMDASCNNDETVTIVTSDVPKHGKKLKCSAKQVSNSEVLACGKCGKSFPTRNKLFQHLKQTGHSMVPESMEGEKSTKRKGKRNKR